MRRLFAAAQRYAAADDPRVAAANFVALVLAWNTPFYPLYLVGTAGAEIRSAAWLTLCVFPIFLAVPLITKWHSLCGRVLLTIAGIGNTLFCTWLLGEASGTQLFLLPCITLAALVFRRTEPIALFSMLALPILAGVSLNGRYPISPFACSGRVLCEDFLAQRDQRRGIGRVSGPSGHRHDGTIGKGHGEERRRFTHAPVTDATAVTTAPHAMSVTVSCHVQTRSTASFVRS